MSLPKRGLKLSGKRMRPTITNHLNRILVEKLEEIREQIDVRVIEGQNHTLPPADPKERVLTDHLKG